MAQAVHVPQNQSKRIKLESYVPYAAAIITFDIKIRDFEGQTQEQNN